MEKKMAKLYFKYGAMGSSKTAQALITKFNYEERGMKVWIAKPSIDSRDGENIIQSRIGLKTEAYVISEDENIYRTFQMLRERYDVVIIDEAQFLTEEQVNQLGNIVIQLKVPVMCFGLKTDVTGNLFEGSKHLLALADVVNEIQTPCEIDGCNCNATCHIRYVDGVRVTDGKSVAIETGNVTYKSVCRKHWLL